MATPAVTRKEDEAPTLAAPLPPIPNAPAPVGSNNATNNATETNQQPLAAAPVPPGMPTEGANDVVQRVFGVPLTGGDNAPKENKAGDGSANAAPPPVEPPKADKPATTASTAAKPAKLPPTQLEIQSEALTQATENIKKALAGDDPIATKELNMLINRIGPRNQAAMDGLAMRLRQSGQDGPGAGDALMAMLARDQGYAADVMAAQISVDSSKRLHDLNMWGVSKKAEIDEAQLRLNKDYFKIAMDSGQWDIAAATWGSMFPGVPFDVSAAKLRDPTELKLQAVVADHVDQLIKQGDGEGAKRVFLDNVRANPEIYGFKAGEGDKAVEAYKDVDFTAEAFENRRARSVETQAGIRDAILRKDKAGAMMGIDRMYADLPPGQAERDGHSALGSMSIEDINKVRTAAGKSTVSAQEVPSLDPVEFAKDKTYADGIDNANGVGAVNSILDDLIKVNPEIGTNPALRQASYNWIFKNLAGLDVNPDGSLPDGWSFDSAATIPPWEPESVDGHLYFDWPVWTFDKDGNELEQLRSGGEPYSDTYKKGDLTNGGLANNAKIDSNWETYVMKMRSKPDERLNRTDWYMATKGGSQVMPLPGKEKVNENDIPDLNNTATKMKLASQGWSSLSKEEKDSVRTTAIPISPAQLPTSQAQINDMITSGERYVKIGNEVVEIVSFRQQIKSSAEGARSARHQDWVNIRTESGRSAWIDRSGKIFFGDDPPPEFQGPYEATFPRWNKWYSELGTFDTTKDSH